jgi:hypothetical protein
VKYFDTNGDVASDAQSREIAMGHRSIALPHVLAMSVLGMLIQPGTRQAHAVDVLTQHYDNARTGATQAETTLRRRHLGVTSPG